MEICEKFFKSVGNVLTPVVGDGFTCKTGSWDDGCGGCLSADANDLSDMVLCCDVVPEGGGGEALLDWLLGDILTEVDTMWPGRLLTDQDNLAVIGYSLGGLFSCHAAWTRPESVGRAACQSSSFWWPTNATLERNMFHFVNVTLEEPLAFDTRLT